MRPSEGHQLAVVNGTLVKATVLLFLVFGVFLASGSYALDPGVEIAEQADSAVRQFEVQWSGKVVTLTSLLEDEKTMQARLYQLLRDRGVTPGSQCTSEVTGPQDQVTLLRIRQLQEEFAVAVGGERQNYQSWERQLADAKANKASYDTQLSLYDRVVWSRARMRMLLLLHSVFEKQAALAGTRIQNGCALEQLIAASDPALRGQLEDLRRSMAAETKDPRSIWADFYGVFHPSLSIILSMP